MKITSSNISRRVVIGLKVRVLRHPDPGLIGLEGIVVWETSNTLVVRVNRGGVRRDVTILKDGGLFEFETPDGERITVEGFRLIGRPEERVKRA
ncbi:MAG: ribonuclease P protein component 1 [Acidilobus sp.]